MSTPKKNRRAAPGLAASSARRNLEQVGPETPARTDVGGRLPGDEHEDMFWEERVASWLGVARKRVATVRRRGLREGAHWIVHRQRVVFTVEGLQKLRDFLGPLAAPQVVDGAADEPPAPVGPPERKSVRIVKIYPNTRLMLALAPESTPEKPVQVLVRVRDNRQFMPGMVVPVVHDLRSSSWQYVGRLPRRKGRM